MIKPKRFYGKGIPGVNLEQLHGQLIVVEGADGSGRSTQIDLLRSWMERNPDRAKQLTDVEIDESGKSEGRFYEWK